MLHLNHFYNQLNLKYNLFSINEIIKAAVQVY